FNAPLLALQETRQQARGNPRIVGELGVVDELIAQSVGIAVDLVVRTAGELDETTSTVALAVRWTVVPQVPAIVVKIEGVATGRGVEPRLEFADGLETLGLGANGG